MSTAQHQQVCTLDTEVVIPIHLNYLLYLPEGYAESTNDWPLVLFLHGAGERGDQIGKVAVNGPPKRVEEGTSFPFILASPQCPELGWWASDTQVEALKKLLATLEKTYRVDLDRVYLTGLSMGGYGTWRLAYEMPEHFAAIVPVCGGGKPAWAERIKHLPTRVFHGAKDQVVAPEKSEEMVNALRAVGADVEYTVYPETGHDAWTATYSNPELYDWLLTRHR